MEKRKRIRIPASITAEITVDGVKRYYPETMDVSMGGCFLPEDKPFTKGTIGTILLKMIELPGAGEVRGEFIVVRLTEKNETQPAGMGLQFTKLDTDGSIFLFNFIRYQGGDITPPT